MKTFTIEEIITNLKDNYINIDKHGDNAINIYFGITNYAYYVGNINIDLTYKYCNVWLYNTENISDPSNAEEVMNNSITIDVPNQNEFFMSLFMTIKNLIESN